MSSRQKQASYKRLQTNHGQVKEDYRLVTGELQLKKNKELMKAELYIKRS